MKTAMFVQVLGACFALTTSVGAAENVHLTLMNGAQQVQGESTQSGMANTIECAGFQLVGTGSGATHHWDAINITKRIDKSSPSLLAFMMNGTTLSATFRFYRAPLANNGVTGTGALDQFYTIALQGVHVVAMRQHVESTHVPANALLPPLEEVNLTFTGIKVTYGASTAQDNWSN